MFLVWTCLGHNWKTVCVPTILFKYRTMTKPLSNKDSILVRCLPHALKPCVCVGGTDRGPGAGGGYVQGRGSVPCDLSHDACDVHTPSPPVDRMTDRHLWKHYLPGTSSAGGKYVPQMPMFNICYCVLTSMCVAGTFCRHSISRLVSATSPTHTALTSCLDNRSVLDVWYS